MGGCTTRDGINGDQSRNVFKVGEAPPFWKQFEIESPSLLCTQSFDIANVCISRTCGAISLYCDNPACPACPKIHPHCGSVKLDVITKMLQKRGEHVRQMVAKMEETEVKTFQSIQSRRTSLLEDFFMKGFEDVYGDIIQSVYFGKKTISMNGDMAEEFYWRLKESNSKLPRIESEMVKFFKREIERIAAPAIKLEEDVLEQYIRRARVMKKQTQQQIELSQSQIAESNFRSKILPNKHSEEVKFIEQSLDFPKKIRLIFTASEYGFKSSRFHEVCDNVPHTLTLLETQFGKVIGGYTPLTWNCSKGFAVDDEGLGFLFSVDLRQKFTLTRREKAIQCHPDYGPVFGSGADLAVSNQCNRNFQSCLNFPYCYNYKDAYKFGQDTWTKICGAKDGKTFRIKQYEVFEVIW